MSTSYQTIYDSFFDKLEKDETFIDYVNLTENECLNLAKLRSHSYLLESISELTSNCEPDIDFNNYDDELDHINEDLTKNEIKLLVDIMFKIYMSRDIPKLHVFILNYTPKEMEVFSPANERTSFINLIKKLEEDVKIAIDNYKSRNRITGALKGIDYDVYSEY